MSFGMNIKREDIRTEAKDEPRNYTREMFKEDPFQIQFQYPKDKHLLILKAHDYDFNTMWAYI